MQKTRIAVAGAGYIGQAHMGVAQASRTCTLSAIVDPSPAAVDVAVRAGVPLYRSLDALIAHDKPDGIVLATPNQLHVEHALQCIEAHVPQLLEKPIAPTVAEAQGLVDKIDATGATVLIGHHRAHSPIMAYPTYSDEDCYTVAGTFGSLSIPTMRMKTYRNEEDRSWWKPFDVSVAEMIRDDPIKLQMEHFGAVVRGEAQPIVSARDGLQNLKITEAIVEAAKSGRIVEIA